MSKQLTKAELQQLVNENTVSAARLIAAELEGRYPQKADVFSERLKVSGVIIPKKRKRRSNTTLEDLTHNRRRDVSTKTVISICVKVGILSLECCAKCKRTEHDGKPISDVLQLDHKNGDHYDNRPENIWMICACCHQRQPTSNRKKNALVYIATQTSSQTNDTSDTQNFHPKSDGINIAGAL